MRAGVQERERIDEPDRIRALLASLLGDRRAARALGPNGEPLGPLTVEAVNPALDAPFPLILRAPPGLFDGAMASIELFGWLSVYRFALGTLEVRGETYASALPRSIERTRRRKELRVRVAPGKARFAFVHPHLGCRIERDVVCASFGGIAIEASEGVDALASELAVERATLSLDEGDPVAVSARVRHVTRVGTKVLAGLSIEPLGEGDRRRWRARVHTWITPETSPDGRIDEALWDLYEQAGYFSLSHKSEADFAPLRQKLRRFSERLARAPHLGGQIVHRGGASGVEAQGSLTLARTYEGAVSCYQLARRPDRAPNDAEARTMKRKVLRGINVDMMLRMDRDIPEARWWIGTVHQGVRFSHVYSDVTQRYVESGRADAVTFSAYEASTRAPSPPSHGEPAVSDASAGEVDLLLEAVARVRSAAFRDAHDLVPERIALPRIASLWADAGLRRERAILVARDARGPAAGAVLELVDDGVHLFGLLDSVRIFPLREGPLATPTGTALLHAARAWYRARGKEKYVYYLEQEDDAHALRAGLTVLDKAQLIVLRSELMPELVEQIHQVTASRP